MTNPQQQQQRVHHPPLLAGLVIRVEIRSGKNLVPKDRPHRRLLHGMKREAATTSDPYVMVRLQNQTYGLNQVHAKTPVIPKNCQNPEWDTTIVLDLTAHGARDILQQICSSSSSSNGGNTTTATTAATTTSTTTMTAAEAFSRRTSQIQLGLPTIDCEIYDRDFLSFDDPMGIVQIPLTLDYFHRTDEAVDDDGKECRTTTNTVGPHWYMVGTEKFTSDSSGTRSTTFCANATGELHLTIKVEAQWMVRINEYLAHPQTTPRSILLSTPVAVELAWTTVTANTDHVAMIDTACIAIDGRNGNIDMENCIFYHNLANPNGSIQQHSCTTTTKVTGTATTVFHTEKYSITFASVPHNISMLFFGIFASQPEQYLTNDLIFSMTQRIMNRDTKKGICAYTTGRQPADIHTTSSMTTALIMAQLVRSPRDRNVWSVHLAPSTEDGGLLATFDSGRDFGTLMPELKQLVYDSQLIPNMVLHPNQHETRIGLMRKGGIIRWNDYMRQQEPYSEDVTAADHHRAWKFAIQWENSNLNQFNQIRRMSEPTVEPMKYEMQALLFSGDDHTGLNFECVEQIHTNHPESNFDQSVQLGDKMLDQEEYMSVRLPKLPNYITCVAFMIHVGEVVNPCAVSHKILFQIRDPVTNQAIVKYQQAIPSTLPPYQSLLICCLYRTDTSLTPKAAIPSHENDYEWYFHVVDEIHLTSSHVASVRNVVDRLYSTLHHRNSPAVTTTADTEELAEPDIIL